MYINCYYLVLFDYFSLLLHFLTSMIKLILWLKFFYRQKQMEDMEEKDLLNFSIGVSCLYVYILSRLNPNMHNFWVKNI